MTVRSTSILCALLVMGPGCALWQEAGPAPEPSPEPGVTARVAAGGDSGITFEKAGDGLPTTRIWKSQIAFGDVNGDGRPDLGTVSRLADGPWVWVVDADGHWKPFAEGLPREPFCGGGMAFADINNDGKMDLAIGDHCKGVFAFLGDGEGQWKMAASGLPTIGAEDVAVGDFDNDGCVDIVSVAAQEEGVRAFKGDCAGTWDESSDGLAVTEWGNSVELADVDGDGNLDVVAAYSAGPRVWRGDGTGRWTEASQGLPAPDIHGLYWGIAVGDVNADGRLDIASGSQMPPQPNACGQPGAPMCTGGGAEVFLQQEDGSWKAANEGILAMNALGVTLADLNGDGHTDLVAAGKQKLNQIGGVYGIFPYFGDGTGNWRPDPNTGLPTTGLMRTWGVGVADVNLDDVPDVAFALGDVVAPSWRSGEIESREALQKRAPDRGKFGAIRVWHGRRDQ